jgi:anti-sigma factor RsiW
MSSEERMARAQDYVLGLMSDGDRRRAERDLEVDPEFRDCVMSLAERLRTANREKAAPFSDDGWAEISQRLASLPQMARSALPLETPLPPKRMLAPGNPVGRGAHQTGGARGTAIAVGLAVAFTLGYLAGTMALF